MPQNAAGVRVEPPVSEPIVAGAMPSLIETALPDDEPPAKPEKKKGAHLRVIK